MDIFLFAALVPSYCFAVLYFQQVRFRRSAEYREALAIAQTEAMKQRFDEAMAGWNAAIAKQNEAATGWNAALDILNDSVDREDHLNGLIMTLPTHR